MLTSIGQKLWGKSLARGTGYSPAPDCRPLAGLVVTVVMVTAAVFSGQIPMPWPGPSSGLGNWLAGDLWVVYGLAVLAATAMAMRWEQRRSAEH